MARVETVRSASIDACRRTRFEGIVPSITRGAGVDARLAFVRVVRVGREFGLTVTRQEYRDTGLRGKLREYYEIIPFGFMSRMYDSIVAADKTLALYAAKVSFLQRPALKFDRFPQKAEVAVDRAIKRIMSR